MNKMRWDIIDFTRSKLKSCVWIQSGCRIGNDKHLPY